MRICTLSPQPARPRAGTGTASNGMAEMPSTTRTSVFIEDFLRKLDDADFRFIRIGEAFDEAEVFGDFTENPFNLELARRMTIRPAP